MDACFSPDSQFLTAVLSKYPNLIFMLSLQPIDEDENLLHPSPQLSFEPRTAGPLLSIGPALALSKSAAVLKHIVAAPAQRSFDYVTWNNDAHGEFCLWRVTHSHNQVAFHTMSCLLHPRVSDLKWLQEPETPKSFILAAAVSPVADVIVFVTQRENFGKPTDGIGMQMVDPFADPAQPESPWFVLRCALLTEAFVQVSNCRLCQCKGHFIVPLVASVAARHALWWRMLGSWQGIVRARRFRVWRSVPIAVRRVRAQRFAFLSTGAVSSILAHEQRRIAHDHGDTAATERTSGMESSDAIAEA